MKTTGRNSSQVAKEDLLENHHNIIYIPSDGADACLKEFLRVPDYMLDILERIQEGDTQWTHYQRRNRAVQALSGIAQHVIERKRRTIVASTKLHGHPGPAPLRRLESNCLKKDQLVFKT